MSEVGRQIIYSMVNVSRIHPPQKQVLKDIYISFYYCAKIGVTELLKLFGNFPQVLYFNIEIKNFNAKNDSLVLRSLNHVIKFFLS
jgi:hypothetical protein